MLEASLISGPLWWALMVLGPAVLLWLAWGRGRNWWLRRVPLAAVGGVSAAVLVVLVVDVAWHPFPGSLPTVVVVWAGLVAAGILLALLRPLPAHRKALALLVAVGVTGSGAAEVNAHFGAYPTVRAAMGLPLPNQIKFAQIPAAQPRPIHAMAGATLAAQWSPPTGMPRAGTVTTAAIPGTVSHFAARGCVDLPATGLPRHPECATSRSGAASRPTGCTAGLVSRWSPGYHDGRLRCGARRSRPGGPG